MILLALLNRTVSAPYEETAIPLWIVATVVGTAISFLVGVPVFLVYERLGFRSPSQYALGGAVIGLAISSLFVYSAPGCIALALSASVGAWAFWLYCVKAK
jgi:hypothetical protein